jgi:hypothetical protein
LPPVSTTPAAILQPVLLTPVANNGNDIRLQTPYSELEGKYIYIYIYVKFTTQRCPNKIIKIFLLEDFFHLPPVSMTPVVHLKPRISPGIFEKIRNGRNGILSYSGAGGKLIHEKTRSRKSRDTVPLKSEGIE